MRIFNAKERKDTDIPIESMLKGGRLNLFPEIHNEAFFQVRVKGASLVIKAGKYVGYVPLNEDTAVFVEPKVPIRNLLRVIGQAGAGLTAPWERLRAYAEDERPPDVLLRLLAEAYLFELRSIREDGLAKEFKEDVETGQHPRGAILFDQSVRRLWCRGENHRAVYRYFDQTADTAENQVLRMACRHLLANLSQAAGEDPLVAELEELDDLLAEAGVTLCWRDDLGDIVDGATESRLARALSMAGLFLRGKGVDLRSLDGRVMLPSFLLDLEECFEKYVLAILKEKLSGRVSVQDGNREGKKPLFDDRSDHPATPDCVIRKGGRPTLVIDAKYKAREDRPDINQVIAYAVSYKTPRAVLVRPNAQPEPTGLQKVGTLGGIEISVYVFNLDAQDLAAEERSFAQAILEYGEA